MKYIEEIVPGNAFSYNGRNYILTTDFKSNDHRLAYDLESGFPKWFDPICIVDLIQLYTMDHNNNIIPIKETPKNA